MNAVKIVNMIRDDTNRRIASEKKQRIASCLTVVVVVVLNMICVQSTPAQKILWETGFENYPLKIRKDTFNTATDTVKTGKKSLAIFSENQDEVCVFGKKLNTDKPVISVEFWVYIESGGNLSGLVSFPPKNGLKIRREDHISIGEQTAYVVISMVKTRGVRLANMWSMNGATSGLSPILRKACLISTWGKIGKRFWTSNRKKAYLSKKMHLRLMRKGSSFLLTQ